MPIRTIEKGLRLLTLRRYFFGLLGPSLGSAEDAIVAPSSGVSKACHLDITV